MRRLAVALSCAALLAVPGCGGDDEGDARNDVTAPVPTIPDGAADPVGTDEDTSTAPADTAPAPTAPPTTPAPDPGGGATAPAPAPVPDSPENDTPPPPGSPAERFEEFCETNPGACG